MNLEILREMLIKVKIKKDFYSLSGGLPSEVFCITQTKNGWEVYYSERGKKSHLKIFKNENEACQYFYKFITSDSVVMDNLEF